MAQIMKFWNYPATGSGFYSYNHPTYGTLSANFGNTTYQWNSMPNSVGAWNEAVATLMYQVGVSVDMNYSPSSSGAYVISAASPVTACSEYALKTYFGYRNTLQGIQRINYDETQWVSLLKNELNAGRPVLYAGFGSGGGSGGYNSGHQAVIGIEPPGENQAFNMALYDYVTPSATTIAYGQAFTVSIG
jgi:hypothetical protein